jgi:hypothetical protein
MPREQPQRPARAPGEAEALGAAPPARLLGAAGHQSLPLLLQCGKQVPPDSRAAALPAMPPAAGTPVCQRPRGWPRRTRLRSSPTKPSTARSGRRTFIVRFSSAAWMLTSSAEPMAPPAAAPRSGTRAVAAAARRTHNAAGAPLPEPGRRRGGRRGRTRRLVHHDARVGHAEALILLAGRLQEGLRALRAAAPRMGRAWPCRPERVPLHALCRQVAAGERTSSSVAVLAHSPMAMVLTSGFTASMVSRMAVTEYAWPPVSTDKHGSSVPPHQAPGRRRCCVQTAARGSRDAPWTQRTLRVDVQLYIRGVVQALQGQHARHNLGGYLRAHGLASAPLRRTRPLLRPRADTWRRAQLRTSSLMRLPMYMMRFRSR